MITVYVRLYEELNSILPSAEKKTTIAKGLAGGASLEDLLSVLGLGQEEVDLALVNSESASFVCQLQDRDLVSLYPEFESLDVQGVSALRDRPLRRPRFLASDELRQLAELLQARGYDCLYWPAAAGQDLLQISREQKRILLTQDLGLAKSPELKRCFCPGGEEAWQQLQQVLQRFQLG
ncbi:MAG: Mut7-C RNAse domain-containing protein [Desulfohalobiaceae bacterium]